MSLMHLFPLLLPTVAWGAVAGGLLGGEASKKGAKSAANTAADAQMNMLNRYLQAQQNQQAAARKGILGMAGMQNPWQQAALATTPFFSQPGQDVAMFGATSPYGTQLTPDPADPRFTAPAPIAPPQPTPAPQQPMVPAGPQGWGRFGLS